VVGALALSPDARFTVVTGEGAARRLEVVHVPAGKRAQKGQKVVKRGGVSALRPPEEEG